MSINEEHFSEFEDTLIKTMKGNNPTLSVPYFICFYNPKLELLILDKFKFLQLRLEGYHDFSIEQINLATLMVEILEKHDASDFFEEEEKYRDIIGNDIEKYLKEDLIEELINRLSNKPISHCAIITRYGALYPFMRLSQILVDIESNIKCSLVFLYPSTRGAGYLLNTKHDEINYYRAREINLNV